jgi:hypothetical protein
MIAGQFVAESNFVEIGFWAIRMFPALKIEVEARFAAIETFFRATRGLKGDDAAAAKGMIFVLVYAAYEYTVRSVVRVAIDTIKTHNHKLRDVTPSLLTLFLDPELQSLRDVGGKDQWEKRLMIFERAFSNEAIDLSSGTAPPHDGSHFKYTQLCMMFRVFGINRLPVRRRPHISRINEVVNHRNEIAHGAETADKIGRRYTRSEIVHMVRQMKSVCNLQVSVFESYCSDGARHRRR